MNGNIIASVIAILMALVLAVRGLRNRREPPRKMLLMAVAWLVIIILVVVLVGSVGLQPSS